MKVYLYEVAYDRRRAKAFEEATSAEDHVIAALRRDHTIVARVEDADVAFVNVMNASLRYTHPRANLRDTWWKVALRCPRVPHAALWAYVLHDVDMSFAPGHVTMWAYESEVTLPGQRPRVDNGCADRMCVIPYSLTTQTNPAAGRVAATRAAVPTADEWLARKPCAFVGSARLADRLAAAQRFQAIAETDLFTDRAADEPNAIYARYRFALVLRGDTPTRKAFYQALAQGCFPVVTEDAWVDYGDLFRGRLDLRDLVVLVPTDAAAWDPAKITAQMDAIRNDVGARLDKMRRVMAEWLDYESGAVVRRALEATVAPRARLVRSIFLYALPIGFNTAFLPAHVSVTDVITEEDRDSQYNLERVLHRRAQSYPFQTGCIAKAAWAVVPFYTFLSAWTTRPRFYDVQATVRLLKSVLALLWSWRHYARTPHLLAYADVLWDDARVFWPHVTLPPNTHLVCLERAAKCPLTTHVVPYLAPPVDLKMDRVHRLVYVGRRRPELDALGAHTVEIELAGWRSTTADQWTAAYAQADFSCQPHGDRATRRGFYQSVRAGCMPLITQDCAVAYEDALGSPIDQWALVVPSWRPEDVLPLLQTVDLAAWRVAVRSKESVFIRWEHNDEDALARLFLR